PGRPFGPGALWAALAAGPASGPRGLDPGRFIVEAAAAGGVELNRLARLLVPSFEGPWYSAADTAPGGEPGPDALAPAVGLWTLGRRGLDDAFTAGVTFSVARLTHRDDARTAGACLIALAAAHLGAGPASRGRADVPGWIATSERWGGAPVPAWARITVDAALATPDDGHRAGAAAHGAGGNRA